MAVTIEQASVRIKDGIKVFKGARGTLLLGIDGLTIGIVQPNTGTKADFNRAVAAAKADLIVAVDAVPLSQGIIYLPHDNEPGYNNGSHIAGHSADEATAMGEKGLTYEVEPKDNLQEGDQLDNAVRFIDQWEARRQQRKEHSKIFGEQFRARLAASKLQPR